MCSQKTLVDVTLENTVIRDQIKSLKQTHEESMEKLKEKQKQLETARVENELLRLKVFIYLISDLFEEYIQGRQARRQRDDSGCGKESC